MEQKKEKMFLIWKIISFESATSNCQNPEGDTCPGSEFVTKQP